MIANDRSIKLRKSLENLNSLPAMPMIAQKLLSLSLDTPKGEAQLLQLIAQDPQISARIVGLANSPMMRLSRKISVVNDAAMLLGLSKVKSVAIGIASMSNFSALAPVKHFNPRDLWLHCMTIAIVMRNIAQCMPAARRPNEDQIFLAGLLHDIGFMALHHIDSALSSQLHQQLQQQPDRPAQDIELEFIGITHAQIGAQLARHWDLPQDIVDVLSLHHAANLGQIAQDKPILLLLAMAEKLLPNFGITENTTTAIAERDWMVLGIDPSRAEENQNIANELAVQASQLSGVF